VWAVGDNGKVLRLVGPRRWGPPPVALPTEVEGVRLTHLALTDVNVLNANDVLILGNDPAGGRFLTILFHFDGTRWQTDARAGETGSRFTRTRDGTLYIARGGRVHMRRRASSVWAMSEPIEGQVRRVRELASGAVELLVTTRRTAAVYEAPAGTVNFVRVAPVAQAADIAAVHRSADGVLWLAGSDGAILRYAP
jgi:hypothetical protein